MTTTVLNTKIIEVENKIPDPSSLVATTVLNKKIKEVQNKIPGHAKYITAQEFNKLTTNILAARLKQANLVSKTNFDDKLRSFNRKITSKKTKYLEVQRKISLTTNDYNFSLGTIYFSGNDGSQNTLVYQPTHDTYVRIKKSKCTDYVLSWKSNLTLPCYFLLQLLCNKREYIIVNLNHYTLLSCIA